jgi:hypothetical protein
VRAYSKGQKNDFRDAEAIAEAVQRPTMKFVATKTAEQLDLLSSGGVSLTRAALVVPRSGPNHGFSRALSPPSNWSIFFLPTNNTAVVAINQPTKIACPP